MQSQSQSSARDPIVAIYIVAIIVTNIDNRIVVVVPSPVFLNHVVVP